MLQHTQTPPEPKRTLGLKILLVDDHALNRFMVQTILEKWSCEIIIAEDGLAAIRQLLANEGIDLILMDMRMPVMDGKTASGFIRKRVSASVPIIAITSDTIRYNSDNSGNDISFFISKPFTQEELYEKAMQALEARVPELPSGRMDLSRLLSEDKRFIAKMIDLFLEDTPGKIAQLEEAIEGQQDPVLMDIAHTLKPSLQYLADPSVAETALRIEKHTGEEGSLLYAESLLLISELEKLSRELQAFRGSLDV